MYGSCKEKKLKINTLIRGVSILKRKEMRQENVIREIRIFAFAKSKAQISSSAPNFRSTDSITCIPPLLISKISRFLLSTENVQATLYQTGSETPKTGFLASRLI